MSNYLMTIGNFLLIMAAIPAIVFPLAYWRMADWRSSHMGRHLMSFMGGIGAIMLLTILTLVFGQDWYPRQFIRLTVWGLLAFLFWWRLFLLFAVNRYPERYGEDTQDPADIIRDTVSKMREVNVGEVKGNLNVNLNHRVEGELTVKAAEEVDHDNESEGRGAVDGA